MEEMLDELLKKEKDEVIITILESLKRTEKLIKKDESGEKKDE